MNTINATDLAHFTGSENRFFIPMFRAYNYTEGVRYLLANGAGWLVTDTLAVLCGKPKVKREAFVCITLTVDTVNKCGKVVMDDGNGKVLHTQKLDYTDFPLPEVKMFATDGMLMLSSEY
jgi:hypothetical protein